MRPKLIRREPIITPPIVSQSVDGKTVAIPADKSPKAPTCEVCGGKPSGKPVRDMQEATPAQDHHGLWWRRWRTHSIHFFCGRHRRVTQHHPLPPPERFAHVAKADPSLAARLTVAHQRRTALAAIERSASFADIEV